MLVPSRVPTLALSAQPSPPVSRPQPSAPDRPVVDASTTAHSPATTVCPLPARPPLLSHLRSLPNSLAFSLAMPTRTGSCAIARRRPLPVMWPPSRTCPVQRHSELRLTVSCSRHPSVCPFLPCCVRYVLTGVFLAQPKPRRRRPEAPSHPHRSPNVPKFALEVSILPMPLFRQVSPLRPCNCSPELAAPPRNLFQRGLRSLAPPCRFCAHGRVRRVALNVSNPFPKPLEPRRG
jgi:hypothetical protein